MIDSIIKFLKSFAFAGKGIVSIIASERNMRVHVFAAIAVIVLGIYFKITKIEWCLSMLCIGLVMAAESFNTAIEALTDIIKKESHPIAGKVKDAAAGGVLLASIAAAVTGLLIFWKYFFPA